MLDTGSSSEGPILTWTARGWVLRTGYYMERFVWARTCVIFDIANMKTGWCYTAAWGAPQWQWNRSPSRFEPQPSEKYKKGFSIPCAIDNRPATWEQIGPAILNSLTDLAPEVSAGLAANPGKLPQMGLVRFRLDTTIPELKVVRWVDRPVCLGGEDVDAKRRAQWRSQWLARQAERPSRLGELEEF
jgi:hypothetical protein